jgi:hypothetical protein
MNVCKRRELPPEASCGTQILAMDSSRQDMITRAHVRPFAHHNKINEYSSAADEGVQCSSSLALLRHGVQPRSWNSSLASARPRPRCRSRYTQRRSAPSDEPRANRDRMVAKHGAFETLFVNLLLQLKRRRASFAMLCHKGR